MDNRGFSRLLLFAIFAIFCWINGEEIHVAIDAEYPPYEFVGENGVIAGFIPELLAEIEKSSNFTFILHPMSWPEAVESLNIGTIDLISMIYTEERTNQYIFSEPHSRIDQSIFINSDHPHLITKDDIKTHSIALQKNDISYEQFYSGIDSLIQIVDTKREGFHLLQLGEVYAFVTATQPGLYLLKQYDLENIAISQVGLFPQNFCFASIKNNTTLINTINEQLVTIKKSEIYPVLMNKWFISHDNWIEKYYLYFVLVLGGIFGVIVIAILWNITLQRQVRKKTAELSHEHELLLESEELYAAVAATATDGIIIIDSNSIIQSTNSSFGEIFGYNTNELTNKPLSLLIPDEFRDLHLQANNKYIETGIRTINWKNVQVPGLHKSGEKVPLEISFGTLEKGGDVLFAGIVRDISARRLAEEALKNLSDFNASIITSIPVGIVTVDRTGNVTSANEAFLDMVGSPSLEETLKLGINIPSLQHVGLSEKMTGSIVSGAPFENNRVPYTSHWGKELIINVRGVPQILKGQNSSGLVILIENITESVKSEQALLESEVKYRSLFENSTDSIFISTQNGDFIDINQAFLSLTGYTRKEIIHSNAIILYANDDERKQYLLDLEEKKSLINVGMQIKRKDNSIIPCLISVSLQFDESTNSHNYQGIIRDISERKKTENIWKTLRLLARELSSALGLNEIGPIIAKDTYSVFDYDAFFLDIIDDKTGGTMGLYNEDTPEGGESPVSVPVKSISLEHVEKLEILSGESQLINRPRSELSSITVPFGFTDRISSSLMYVPIIWENKMVGVVSVQSYTENKYANKDLELLQLFASHIGGALVRIKQLEEIEKALKLAQEGERVKSLFLANMSHEIRTPLNSILGFTDLIKMNFENIATDEQLDFFDMVDVSGKRLLRTIHEILDISSINTKKIKPEKEITNIKNCITTVISELYKFAKQRKLDLEFNFEDEEIFTYVDPYYVQQALSNILDNAIKYTPEGNITFSLKKNRELIIKDTGIGISEDYIVHIFDIFSQESEGYTKEYQGLGLGLALTKKYLQLNDISIIVKSKKHVGTEFILQFPPVPDDKFN